MSKETIDAGVAAIDKWAAQLADVMTKYGPDAAEFALAVGRLGAIREIAYGFGWALLAAVLAKGTWWASKKAQVFYKAGTGDEIPFVFAAGIMGASGFGCFFASLTHFLNLYAWVGMFRPEIYLAAKALGL